MIYILKINMTTHNKTDLALCSEKPQVFKNSTMNSLAINEGVHQKKIRKVTVRKIYKKVKVGDTYEKVFVREETIENKESSPSGVYRENVIKKNEDGSEVREKIVETADGKKKKVKVLVTRKRKETCDVNEVSKIKCIKSEPIDVNTVKENTEEKLFDEYLKSKPKDKENALLDMDCNMDEIFKQNDEIIFDDAFEATNENEDKNELNSNKNISIENEEVVNVPIKFGVIGDDLDEDVCFIIGEGLCEISNTNEDDIPQSVSLDMFDKALDYTIDNISLKENKRFFVDVDKDAVSRMGNIKLEILGCLSKKYKNFGEVDSERKPEVMTNENKMDMESIKVNIQDYNFVPYEIPSIDVKEVSHGYDEYKFLLPHESYPSLHLLNFLCAQDSLLQELKKSFSFDISLCGETTLVDVHEPTHVKIFSNDPKTSLCVKNKFINAFNAEIQTYSLKGSNNYLYEAERNEDAIKKFVCIPINHLTPNIVKYLVGLKIVNDFQDLVSDEFVYIRFQITEHSTFMLSLHTCHPLYLYKTLNKVFSKLEHDYLIPNNFRPFANGKYFWTEENNKYRLMESRILDHFPGKFDFKEYTPLTGFYGFIVCRDERKSYLPLFHLPGIKIVIPKKYHLKSIHSCSFTFSFNDHLNYLIVKNNSALEVHNILEELSPKISQERNKKKINWIQYKDSFLILYLGENVNHLPNYDDCQEVHMKSVAIPKLNQYTLRYVLSDSFWYQAYLGHEFNIKHTFNTLQYGNLEVKLSSTDEKLLTDSVEIFLKYMEILKKDVKKDRVITLHLLALDNEKLEEFLERIEKEFILINSQTNSNIEIVSIKEQVMELRITALNSLLFDLVEDWVRVFVERIMSPPALGIIDVSYNPHTNVVLIPAKLYYHINWMQKLLTHPFVAQLCKMDNLVVIVHEHSKGSKTLSQLLNDCNPKAMCTRLTIFSDDRYLLLKMTNEIIKIMKNILDQETTKCHLKFVVHISQITSNFRHFRFFLNTLEILHACNIDIRGSPVSKDWYADEKLHVYIECHDKSILESVVKKISFWLAVSNIKKTPRKRAMIPTLSASRKLDLATKFPVKFLPQVFGHHSINMGVIQIETGTLISVLCGRYIQILGASDSITVLAENQILLLAQNVLKMDEELQERKRNHDKLLL